MNHHFHFIPVISGFTYLNVNISGTPPYVPDLDGPADVSNFDVDDLMEAKPQVCLYIITSF